MNYCTTRIADDIGKRGTKMKGGNAGPGGMVQWLAHGKAVHLELGEVLEGNTQNAGG